MKRSFIYLAGCALALTACTSEEVVDVGVHRNPIGFENAVMKQSRAGDQALQGDLTKDSFDKFLVYGFYTMKDQTNNPIQVFSGEPVTKSVDGGKTSWSYVNTRYWVPEASYNFFAYSCADVALDNIYGTVGLSLNENSSERQMTISNYRCDQVHNHDLIVAQARNLVGQAITEDNPTPNPNVSLKFEHVLTKIDAVFTSEFSGEYDVVIKDVRIVNFRNIGSFSSNNSKWSAEREVNSTGTVVPASIQLPFGGPNGEGVSNAAEYNSNGSVKRAEKKAATGSVYMIPYSYSQNDVQLRFSLDLYKGEEHTSATLVLGRDMTGTWSPKWEPGKYYTYNIRLTGTATNLQPIVFETATDMNVEGWTSGSSTATDISFSAN
ncbi:MAG: fimbrillin family protein [Muribaculaceae bacterium]|nr:fimbrillin family protein [Muribaculaceae bacterium]